MKIPRLLSLGLIAFALASVGCSASGRINVKNDSASKIPADVQVAYVTRGANPR
jgi:hypothetical protein